MLMDDSPLPQQDSPPALVPASFQDDDDDDQLQSPRVPFDIHKYFGLSPGTPICLDSLPDPPEGEKPQYTYATLVKLAIWSSPQRKLTLSGIYEALENRFSWFRIREHQTAWKTSIRHSLSLLSVFVRIPNFNIHLPGKGSYWTVDFSKGEGYKRPRKRGKKTANPAKDAEKEDVVMTSSSGSKTGRKRLLQEKSPMALAWEAHSTEFRVRDRPGRVNRAHAPFKPYPTAEPRLASRTALPMPSKLSPSSTSPSSYTYPPASASQSAPHSSHYHPMSPPPPSSSSQSAHSYYRDRTHLYGVQPQRDTSGAYSETHWEGARNHYGENRSPTESYGSPPTFSVYEGAPTLAVRRPSPQPSTRFDESDIEDEDDDEAEAERQYFQPSHVYQATDRAWYPAERSMSVTDSASSEQVITPIESYERSSSTREPDFPVVRTTVSRESYTRALRDDSISPISSGSKWRPSIRGYARSASRSTLSSRDVSPLSDEPRGPPPPISPPPESEGGMYIYWKRKGQIEMNREAYRQGPP